MSHGDIESGSQPTDKVWEELRQHGELGVASRGAGLLPSVLFIGIPQVHEE